MHYYGHTIAFTVTQVEALIKDSRTTPDGFPFSIEPNGQRTAILVEEQDHSYPVYAYLKSLCLNAYDPFDDLWDRLKQGVTAARTTRKRITTKDDSWVTTSATSLEITRPHALIKVQLSDDDVLALATNLISHLTTDRS